MVSDIKAKRKDGPIFKKIAITTIYKIDKQQGLTRNYIQYLVTIYNGKESEKEYILHKYLYKYMNKTGSLCYYTPETNTTL